MSFMIHCPHCKIELEAEEQHEGLELTCPSCGGGIQIQRPAIAKISKLKRLGAFAKGGYDKIPATRVADGVNFAWKKLLKITWRQLLIIMAVVIAFWVIKILFLGPFFTGIRGESLESQRHQVYWHKGYEAARTIGFEDLSNHKEFLIHHFNRHCAEICPRRLDDVYAFADGYYYSVSKELKGNPSSLKDLKAQAKYTLNSIMISGR